MTNMMAKPKTAGKTLPGGPGGFVRMGACQADATYVEVLVRIIRVQIMPYKERQKQAEGKPGKHRKPGYRVTNAHAYNQSLKRRGMISLYFCGDDLKAQFINEGVIVLFVQNLAVSPESLCL